MSCEWVKKQISSVTKTLLHM